MENLNPVDQDVYLLYQQDTLDKGAREFKFNYECRGCGISETVASFITKYNLDGNTKQHRVASFLPWDLCGKCFSVCTWRIIVPEN